MVGKSSQAFDALKTAALHDPFWAVRLHALHSLENQSDSTHEISDVLITLAQHDPKPDVRAEAIALLTSKSKEGIEEPVLIHAIETDSSYNVVGNAMDALWNFDSKLANKDAYQFLATSSPRDQIRQSAIGVIEMTPNEQSLDEMIMLIGQHNVPKRTRYNLIKSIATKVSIDSAKVYRVLWNLTNNGDYAIRGTAANSLADIGDVNTLHQLEAQAASRPDMKVTYDSLLERMRKRLGQ
jgi:HEAT repeat protein